MTEQEILDKIASEGWSVIKSWEDSNVGNVFKQTVKALLLYKVVNGIAVNKTIRYAVYEDGVAAWWEKNEFPEPSTDIPFSQRLQTAITSFIVAGQIKAGYIEKSDPINETALVVIVTPTNAYKTFLINKDANGNFQKTEIAGEYPLRGSSL